MRVANILVQSLESYYSYGVNQKNRDVTTTFFHKTTDEGSANP